MNTENKQPAEQTEETVAAAENTEAAETTQAAPETAAVAAETTESAAETAGGKQKKSRFKKREKKALSAETIRRLRHGRAARLLTVGVVILAILFNFVLNILGERFPLTLDLSTNNDFSLSEDSITIAQSIEAPIEVVVFAGEDVFSEAQANIATLGDQPAGKIAKAFAEFYNALKLYNSYSGGKLTYTFIDMNTNPTAVSKYNQYVSEAIETGDILFINGERCKVANLNDDIYTYDESTYYYSGTFVAESIVEQTLATKIKAVQSNTDRVVTIFNGHTENESIVSSLEQIYDLNGYDIEYVDLTRSVEINPNTVCAIIPAPTVDYSAESIERLRNWLDNDGKEGQNLLVFTDATASCPRLYEFLKVEYGLEVTDNIIIENDLNRQYSYEKTWPFADVAASDFTKNAAGEAKVLIPAGRQIIPHWETKTDDSVQYSVPLVTYSNKAALITADNIGAGVNEDVPTVEYKDTIVSMAVAVKEGYQNVLQTATTTRVAVCGSSLMAYPSVLSMDTVENENLLLDTMSGLTGVANTVNISSKDLSTVTADFQPITAIVVGLGIFTVLIPLSLLIGGLIVFLKRRHL